MMYIDSYATVNESQVSLNGTAIPLNANDHGSSFLVQVYHHLGIDYPKFFKMDALCRAGFLASELLIPSPSEQPLTDWAIVSFSSTSSLHTDINYHRTIAQADNYFPSPSIFVYTLANIMIGEVAIRHKILGESSAYILPLFDAERMCEVVEMLRCRNPRVTHILCCWADCINDRIDVSMFLLSSQPSLDTVECNATNINKLRK